MKTSFDPVKLRETIRSAERISILLPDNPKFDEVASALSLYLSLTKFGKKTEVLSKNEFSVEFSQIVGIDKIQNKTDGGNFIISIDDALGSVEKVTHYLSEDTLNLVLHPLPEGKPITREKIKFEQSLTTFSLVFVIGKLDSSQLSNFGVSEQDLYSKSTVVNITNNGNESMAQVKLCDETSPTTSELVVQVIEQLNLPRDVDIARNLFLGMKKATNNFAVPPAKSSTFEKTAWCLKHFSEESVSSLYYKDGTKKKEEPREEQYKQEEYRQIEDKKNVASVLTDKTLPKSETPSPEWLKPKIIRSSRDN